MCSVFEHSKQAYYKQLHQNANTAVKEVVIVGLIKKKREIWKRGSGRNLHQSLKKEFAAHQVIAEKLQINFYFARPYHSWERGANENGYDPLGLHLVNPRALRY